MGRSDSPIGNPPSDTQVVIAQEGFQVAPAPAIQACPVCQGRGTMPAGFFSGLPHTNNETCRPCEGSGLIWIATGLPVRPGEVWDA